MTVAMILAAGRGERMRPLTDNLPKPLLKVRGWPLIVHHLRNLQAAGVKHVVINHAWQGDKLVDYLGDGQAFGLQIHYSAEPQALETAGGIIQALPQLRELSNAHDNFIVVNGDIFTDIDFTQLPTQVDYQSGHLIMVDNPTHHLSGDFALQHGQLCINASPKLTFSGVAVYHFSMFDALPKGKRALAPVLFDAIEHGRMSGKKHSGYWFDIGTPERLEMINRMEFN